MFGEVQDEGRSAAEDDWVEVFVQADSLTCGRGGGAWSH